MNARVRSPFANKIPQTLGGNLSGGDWGLGLLKNRACDYCDDVIAETADVSVGDAWLPEYQNDSRGHSIVVVRNSVISEIIDRGISEGQVWWRTVDGDTVAQSQAGGLRHRREGLAYRLWVAEKHGRWYPPKRVTPQHAHIGRRRQKVYLLRSRLAEVSLSAFAEAKRKRSLNTFLQATDQLVGKHVRLQRTFFRDVLVSVKKAVRRVATRLRFF